MARFKIRKQDALDYHALDRPGKIEVIPTKATKTQRDLALAYSPGVAEPCLEIAAHPEDVYKYTGKGNLVAVISNGTAVLGLGDIGPEASKPVMEGKGILFKIFAGIDVFDIELSSRNIDEFITVVKALEPTFGGVNLEDIKAPDCFEIEERLKAEMNIPVMHDDQHGTAIISGAGLLNALEIVDKKIDQVKIVVSGAGASAISCIKLFVNLGVRKENIVICDSKGVVRADRTDLDKYKREFATTRNLQKLDDAIVGADMFLGLSKANVMTPEMLLSMAERPIVFALANPDPEIPYELAVATRPDVIMATGRSDYPNQVNNVLGFPFIFRGALDVRATGINEEMKLAAVRAIAQLAKETVPDLVNIAYNERNITFGTNYFIPKPLDPRLLTTVAPAVAKAAIASGVARRTITDWPAYENELHRRMGRDENLIRVLVSKARQDLQRVIFAEADTYKVLKAAQIVMDENIAKPILLGDERKIREMAEEYKIDLSGATIVDPLAKSSEEKIKQYGLAFFEKRKRRGYNLNEALKKMRERNYFGMEMLAHGEGDVFISGLTRKYSDVIRPALEIIGTYEHGKHVAGMYMMLTKEHGPVFMADTTMIQHPNADQLAEIAYLAAQAVRKFDIEPRIAMLTYSNFGSSDDHEPRLVRRAVELLHRRHPELIVDGEIQANIAFNREILQENYPFSPLVKGAPNILIFPNLSAGNITYKLMQAIGGAEAVGPIVLGMNKAVHVLQLGSSVREIVNMVTIAAVDAQQKKLRAEQTAANGQAETASAANW
ncbi:MAG: NADP-dependent malic enzyme [Bernardetiaceae bacterium]|jgi:malate dehydrogenase (oxaloacetate-decarboxylating)(NADP+)|nr:NADP-dependent malic enzyme [Bernardetiaceae bacterium]